VVQIRSELPSDADAIEAVTVAAFRHAAHTSHTEQFIVRALRDAGQLVVALVAEEGGVIIGHVAVSPVTIAGISCGWYGLGPISVLPAHQGRGVGTLLMQDGLARLRALAAAGCVVLGEPGYYRRFGFTASSLALSGVPPEYFLAVSFDGPFHRAQSNTTRHLRPRPDRPFKANARQARVPPNPGVGFAGGFHGRCVSNRGRLRLRQGSLPHAHCTARGALLSLPLVPT
jgi:putative acetyltransferase